MSKFKLYLRIVYWSDIPIMEAYHIDLDESVSIHPSDIESLVGSKRPRIEPAAA